MKLVFLLFASCSVLYVYNILYKRQHNKFVTDSQYFCIMSEITDLTDAWTCVSSRERSTHSLRLMDQLIIQIKSIV
jgi:hypothetical protein